MSNGSCDSEPESVTDTIPEYETPAPFGPTANQFCIAVRYCIHHPGILCPSGNQENRFLLSRYPETTGVKDMQWPWSVTKHALYFVALAGKPGEPVEV